MAFGLVVLSYANVYDMTHGHQLQALPISHLASDMLSLLQTLNELTADIQSLLISELRNAVASCLHLSTCAVIGLVPAP